MKLYLDDARPTPEGWERTYTIEQTIRNLTIAEFEELDLDGNLGTDQLTGIEVLLWIKEQIKSGNYVPPILKTHSGDPGLNNKMKEQIERIKCLLNNRLLVSSGHPLKIYLDALRATCDNTWVLTETPEETIDLLRTGRVVAVSLDNDLGLDNDERGIERDGYSVLRWIEEETRVNGFIPPIEIRVHSANASSLPQIEVAINNIRNF